jgi:3',5'-cyclic AMP phosphodiesterase CpdA
MLGPSSFGQEPFSFVQLCDPQLCRYGCEHDAAMFRLAVEYINALQPDFVLICGDLTDMKKGKDSLDDFLEIKNQLQMPCYCLAGNNDIGNVPNQALLDQFRLRVGPDRFSFDHKGYRFIGVNTALWESGALPDETAAQNAWLLQELQDARQEGKPVIVAGHHFVTDRADLFQEYGVVAYLAGHLHANVVAVIDGVQFVATASTCGNGDGSPPGFRLWDAGALPRMFLTHEYLALPDSCSGRDSDGDHLPDAQEDVNLNQVVDPGETDWLDPDTDDDGINDGMERAFGLDPLTPDSVSLPAAGDFALVLLAALLAWMGCRSHRTRAARSRRRQRNL